jgi:hypothetical protein
MPPLGPTIVYSLCLATSALCAAMLVRAYLAGRSRLLLWSAVCFVLLALNNLLVVVDMVMLQQVDLTIERQAAALAAILVLLYGFVWEARS